MLGHVATPHPPDRPQQDSPFMRLPSELRVKIYDFALQHIISDIIAHAPSGDGVPTEVPFRWSNENKNKSRKKRRVSPFFGALAILHTSRPLRNEALDSLDLLVLAQVDQLVAKSKRIMPSSPSTRSDDHDEEEAHKIWNRLYHKSTTIANGACQAEYIRTVVAWARTFDSKW